MKKYWRELGEAYAALPRSVVVIFTIVSFLPGILMVPLVWYMAKMAAATVAQLELLNAVRSGVKLEPSKVNELMMLLFSASPSLLYLVGAISVVTFICFGLFVLVRTAGYFAVRGEKSMANDAPTVASA
ncbi:hypothetical protein [Pseudomonas sp. NPDC089569]|uniref:hypothetical protein n=1 Tax=Pseudomonas sp. NPDC089569 TaxID=3390722 RepID=UPI003D05B062